MQFSPLLWGSVGREQAMFYVSIVVNLCSMCIMQRGKQKMLKTFFLNFDSIILKNMNNFCQKKNMEKWNLQMSKI